MDSNTTGGSDRGTRTGRPDLITEHDVAVRYHVTIHSVRRWRRAGRITFLKIGKQVLFRPRDIDRFETAHEVAPQPLSRVLHRARGSATMIASGTKED